jgi:diguanylate cyclase (GGDEF)-like protein/PAS domain S-box-containing protein
MAFDISAEKENDRLRALAEYQLMDTQPEDQFDRITHLAARLFDVPIVLISLLGEDRQFFKARFGLDVCETSREVSFCAHAILADDILVVSNALKDRRFSANPLVLGPPFIRFYAGQPLIAPSGAKIGTLCLIDSKSRPFSAEDRQNLADLAHMVMDRMEISRLNHVKSISQIRFENIAATSPDAIICSSSLGNITFWNKSAERLFGYTAADAIGRDTSIIIPAARRQVYERELHRLQKGERLHIADRTVQLNALRRDGTEFPAEFSLSTWREGDSVSVGSIVRDVSDRKANEERLYRLAAFDPLTQLPNRGAWKECISHALASKESLSLFLLDLDGFKDVNDSLGHSAGDAVLQEVASRLRLICSEAIMIARLGGDEFVVLFNGGDPRGARERATQIIFGLCQPFKIDGRNVEIGSSIGIALAPEHGARGEDLLAAADLALYRAKADGKGRYEFFTQSLRQVAIARRQFELELRRAFEGSEFELFYQPQVSTSDRRVLGAEALLRWNHPDRGLLTPASFIDVLSKKPLAPTIGEWIIREACEQTAIWRQSHPSLKIGVNLFEVQIRSLALPRSIRKILDETRLPAEALELELVESSLLASDAASLKMMHELRGMGVGLAFDDYGTGYAALSLLKRYPVSRLKIDRTFVRDVNSDPENAALVQAILYLARNFRMDVIAEGVEDERQLEFLAINGCPEAQGYLFGRPMPAEQFSLFLTDSLGTTDGRTPIGSISAAIPSPKTKIA